MEELFKGELLVGLTFLATFGFLFPIVRSDILSKLKRIGKKSSKPPPPKEFNGVVQFDLGQVTHSSFGTVYVKSEFARIKPKFERAEVAEEDIQSLQKELSKWIKKHFNVQTRGAQYFDELSKACVLFSVYVNPFHSLFSQQMDIVIKTYFWLWYADDEIEDEIEKGIPFDILKIGTDQINKVLSGNTQFEPIKNYSFFEPLFNAMVDLHKLSAESIPNYPHSVGPTQMLLQRYFEAQRWFSLDTIDGRYSEESFRAWRRIIAYFDGIAEVVAMVEGIQLSDEIRRAPTFLRILDIANAFGGFVNDLIGMKKEFKNSQKDNLIVFKVLNKNIPLELAVQQVCALMDSELRDYVLLKQAILREFNYEENLVKYIDILESLIDGHNRIYAQSTRHKSVDCIKLTRVY